MDDLEKLSILNPQPVRLQGPSLLHHLVHRPTAQPALERLEDGITTITTYHDLHDSAENLASRIVLDGTAQGTQPIVPVLLHQGPQLYTALLAILKLGGAFCPLNIDAPPERLQFIFRDVSAGVVITNRELAQRIPKDTRLRITLVESDDSDDHPEPGSRRDVDPNDLAYVMYTSGSTGTPKGVGVSHDAVTQALLAHDRHIPQFSRFLQFAAPTFDVSVFEIFFPLFRGSTLVSVPRQDLLDDLPAVLQRLRVDACELTPTVAGSLLRKRKNAPGLKLLLTIGEMLTPAIVQEFGGSEDQSSILWAMYGPTEAAIHCTLQRALPVTSSTHNIGLPLVTVSAFIIEPASTAGAEFRPLPRGETGELAVGGHQLAAGYLNNVEKTNAAFINTSFGRLYRTGDKARIKHDGSLECLGRLSEGQIKLRGQRIELGEIEHVIMDTPGCHGVVVALVGSILVAFCAVDAGVTDDAILEKCEAWLPHFMVPGDLVLLASLPHLPSGKVDQRALRHDYEHRQGSSTARPDSVRHGRLLAVLSEILDSPVSLDMTLASLGVDSLVAIQLASSLRIAGFETNGSEILRLRKVSDLCSKIKFKAHQEAPKDASLSDDLYQEILSSCSSVLPGRHDVTNISPCTPLQTAMLAQSCREPTRYCNQVEIEIDPEAEETEILEAIRKVCLANEILRTTFVEHNGEFYQVVNSSGLDENTCVVVDSFSDNDLETFASNVLQRPFVVQLRATTSNRINRIMFRLHHAIYDGWSMDLLLADLSDLLSGLSLKPRQQYHDITSFYTQKTSSPRATYTKAFWAEYLQGCNLPPFPKLVSRRVLTPEIKSASRIIPLRPEQLLQAAGLAGCSTQSFFQAGLITVWSGILHSSDVVIGSATSGRTLPVDGIEGISGPCVCTIPLRVDFSHITTAGDLLNSITYSNSRTIENCALPLSEIQKVTDSTNDLYHVLFAYQASPETSKRNRRRVREIRHLDRIETKLLIEVEPHEHGFNITATYHISHIPPKFAELFLSQIEQAVHLIISNPQDSIESLKQALEVCPSVYNLKFAPTQEQPQDLALLFEDAALKFPKREAVQFARGLRDENTISDTMNYEELNARGNQIATLLLECGARPGDTIGVVMEKSLLLYTSILGIAKARCAYLPLLPTTPIARAREIFSQARLRYCVVDSSSDTILQKCHNIKFVRLDTAPLHSWPLDNLDIEPDDSRLAYVIYTSGTTGAPKGVAISQKNITSNVAHLKSIYPGLSSSSPRLLQACSQAFDVSVFEIFFAWHTGMCLCSADNDILFNDLEKSIRKFEITHLSLTPTVASLINPANVPMVEFLVTAGEPMTRAISDKWGEILWQGYGPSETTNIVSVKRMTRDLYIQHLGFVFPNTSAVVLFPNSLQPVPRGWVGEFCFGGDQVGVDYLNMPDLTAEKFIDHARYGRLYRSGDMGRMLDDGSLLILGRLDKQIKLRGQRIEPSEVNSVVTSTRHAETAETMLVRLNSQARDQLATFYVPQYANEAFEVLKSMPDVSRDIFALLKAQLPVYMVPSYLIPVSRIPLTSSGKVDTRTLNEAFSSLGKNYLESVAGGSQVDDNSKWSSTEEMVALTIAETFTIPRSEIGRWTPFSTLGVDSITAIRLLSSLKAKAKLPISISTILQNSSVAQLSRSIDQTSSKSISEKPPAMYLRSETTERIRNEFSRQHLAILGVFPCLPLQEAMLSSRTSSYYNQTLIRVFIHVEEMQHYWSKMVERHDILRTCFVTTNQGDYPFAQVILKNWIATWKLFATDISLSRENAAALHAKSAPEPLDANSPPLSLAIIHDKDAQFLSFVCHHALYDGAAMERLLTEIEMLAHKQILPPRLSYASFVQEALNIPKDSTSFWIDLFRGFSPVTLFWAPIERKRINETSYKFALDVSWSEIKARSRILGVSFLSLCQAAWGTILAILSKQTDICFGNVVSGRTIPLDDIERLVAPCFNTVPLRKDLKTTTSSLDLVKSFQDLNTSLLQYQFVPLRMVQKIVRATEGKLFDTLLLVQQSPKQMDETIWKLESESGAMDVALICEVVPCLNLDSAFITIHYDADGTAKEIMPRLADLLRYVFKNILDCPNAVIPTRESLPISLKSASSLDLKVRQWRIDEAESGQENEINSDHATELELNVRAVLSQLSKIPASSISTKTTIFRLGLDSINAVQIASLLRGQGHPISASDVIEGQTCQGIASRMTKRSSLTSDFEEYDFGSFQSRVASEVREKLSDSSLMRSCYPCTPLQCAMLSSLDQDGVDTYLNMLTLELEKDMKTSTMVQGMAFLVESHSMLRTGFVAIRHPHASFAMIQHPSISLEQHIFEMDKECANPFSIDEWHQKKSSEIRRDYLIPPWRAVLYVFNGNLRMTLLIHHALYDAYALDLILVNLARTLKGHALEATLDIKPGLSEILSRALHVEEETQTFWEEKASRVVMNKFPIMTPLREDASVVETEEISLSMTTSSLHSMAAAQGVTLQAAIQAAWIRILSSYLGEASVTYGVTISSRNMENTRDTPLPCLATLPVIACNFESNKELLNSMMDYSKALHKHQHAPLSQIQKWLGRPAENVFDTLVVYHLESSNQPKPWTIVSEEASVEYPVSLEVEPRGTKSDHMLLRVTYESRMLPRQQAAILLRQMDATLSHLLESPDGQETELHKLRPEIFAITPAQSASLVAPVRFLHEFVEVQAQVSPHSTALEFVSEIKAVDLASRVWTYLELDEQGNRIANMLLEHTSPGNIVAIHFDKCPEAYFSILGILKAGCAFVALDPSAPQSRKEYILSDSQASCLLTDDKSLTSFSGSCTIIEVKEQVLDTYSPTRVPTQQNPEDTCYCLYTSGTTGTPKGCEVTHDNAVQAMMAFQELFRGHWSSDSRWLQFAALHFDVSILEQYWSWSVGISVVAAKKDLILSDLTGSINRLGITHIDLTPSLARLTHPETVPSLCKGVFITGGEQLKQEILDAWGPKAVIYNAYGPTEATIGVTMYQRVPINGRPSNIGRQFPNVGTYVVQPNTDIPVLQGGVGELLVYGKLVGKGYLNRPELTKAKFPVIAELGERVYRTGDMVRILHDGCFDFLGRADDQIKLRGQRLEIGEINHTIRSGVPEIQDVATIVASHPSSGKDMLVSFVVDQSSMKGGLRVLPSETDLLAKARASCQEQLPGYMVPTYFFRLPFIPLSPNNKLESKQLKDLFLKLSPEEIGTMTGSPTRNVQPADPELCRKLLDALSHFSDVDVSNLSLSATIFDIGVDSISVIRLSSFLKEQGFVNVSPALILRHPAVSDLAFALTQNDQDQYRNQVKRAQQLVQAYYHRFRNLACQELNLKPTDIEYISPCSPLQQGIIARSITEGNGVYYHSVSLVLDDGVSADKLRDAWFSIVRSEAILRSAFISTQDGFIQVARKEWQPEWIDVISSYEDNNEDSVQDHVDAWIRANDPVISTPIQFLFSRGRLTQVLTVLLFHALYDGISLEKMLKRVGALYMEKPTSPSPSFLQALTYGPLWNHSSRENAWRNYLHEWKPTKLWRRRDSASGTNITSSRTLVLDQLNSMCQRYDLTLQSVFLAVWTSVLQEYRQPESLIIGVILSGRALHLSDVGDTIGPLFNTLPFFPETEKSRTWASLMRACREFNLFALVDPHVPLKSIQKWCSGGSSIVDNLFTFQIEQPEGSLTHMPWKLVDRPSLPDYPLALEATLGINRKLELILATHSDDFVASQIEDMLDKFVHNLQLLIRGRELNDQVQRPQQLEESTEVKENGLKSSSLAFHWNDSAMLLRKEISKLSGTHESKITEHTTLIELGLDSVDTIQLATKLRTRKLFLSASTIMKTQTIYSMLENQTPADQPTDGDQMKPYKELKQRLHDYVASQKVLTEDFETILPTTALQDAMIGAMVVSQFKLYFNHEIFELSQETDMGRLKLAWRELVSQSPILRTGFYQVNDQELDMAYGQFVSKECRFSMTTHKLSTVDQLQGLAQLAVAAAKSYQGREKLVQVRFAKLPEGRFMVVSLSHALYDGWSLQLLYEDLKSAYNGHLKQRPNSEALLSNMMLQQQSSSAEFWSNYLREVEPCIMAPDNDEGELMNAPPATFQSPSKFSLQNISKLCRERKITLQTLCQTAWALVLAQTTQSLDVVFGVVLSRRDFEGAEEILFPTMNTVALRCILHGSPATFLSYIEESMADIRAHQSMPLRKIQAAAGVRTRRLFDSIFILQKSRPVDKSQVLFNAVDGCSAVEYPVCIEAESCGDSLIWRSSCIPSLGPSVTAKSLVEGLDFMLHFMMNQPDSDVLSFTDNKVSICSGPQFTLAVEDMHDVTPAAQDGLPVDEWTETSSTIRKVLSKLSGVAVESIKLSNNLFHIGLDSISAIKVSTILRQHKLQLKVQDLLRATSIAQMAEFARPEIVDTGIDGKKTNGSFRLWSVPDTLETSTLLEENGINLEQVEVILYPSKMQVFMMSAWQNSDGAIFFPEFVYQLQENFTPDHIYSAWHIVISQTPILRTCLVATATRLVPMLQVVLRADAGMRNPMVQLKVENSFPDTKTLVKLRIHHALYDAFSLQEILQRLMDVLHTGSMSLNNDLSAWSRYLGHQNTTPTRMSTSKFWIRYLNGCEDVVQLPVSTKSSTLRSSYYKPKALSNCTTLRAISSENGISVQALTFAAYAMYLAAGRESATVVFGVYLANRTVAETIPSTFPTLNLLPLKVLVSSKRQVMDIASDVQKDLVDISSKGHVDTGLWDIAWWTGVRVTSFVNFFSDVTEITSSTLEGLSLVPSEEDNGTLDSVKNTLHAWMKNNPVADDFPPSVDIEVALRDDSLDLGVFGPSTSVDDSRAVDIVDGIVRILGDIQT